MQQFRPGMKARTSTEIEVDDYTDDEAEHGFTCIIAAGALVEIVGEPISAAKLPEGIQDWMIAVRATDTDGIERVTMVDLEDLTITTFS